MISPCAGRRSSTPRAAARCRGPARRAGRRIGAVRGALEEELRKVVSGGSVFKAVRGEYGCGKTFFSRWLGDRRKMGFATSEVQISETETPLHRLETVYRRLTERLATVDTPRGRCATRRRLVFHPGRRRARRGDDRPERPQRLLERTGELRSSGWKRSTAPRRCSARPGRGYRRARWGDRGTARRSLAWLSGQPNVAAAAKRLAGVKGDIDHFALQLPPGRADRAPRFGPGGHAAGADEVETIQRVRGDVRDKSRTRCGSGSTSRFGAVSPTLPGDHRHPGLLRRPPGRPKAGTARPAPARRFSDRRAIRQPASGEIRLPPST